MEGKASSFYKKSATTSSPCCLVDSSCESQTKSTENLLPGNYQITANMSLKIPLSSFSRISPTMYLTNPANPLGINGQKGVPLRPVSNNAFLTVNSDGTKILTLEFKNPIVCVQSMGAACGARIISTSTKPIEANPSNRDFLKKHTDRGITTRISCLVIAFDSNASEFVFSSCKQYATYHPTKGYLDTFSEDITLKIDYSSAVLLKEEK